MALVNFLCCGAADKNFQDLVPIILNKVGPLIVLKVLIFLILNEKLLFHFIFYFSKTVLN